MSPKISKLEKENQALHDENVSLRLENLEIKMTKIVYEKDEKKEDGRLGPCYVSENVFEYNHSKQNQKMDFWVSQRTKITSCQNLRNKYAVQMMIFGNSQSVQSKLLEDYKSRIYTKTDTAYLQKAVIYSQRMQL